MQFWNGAFADCGRLATGIISLSAMFLSNYVCFSNNFFNLLCIYYSIIFFDNSLLTIPGRPQLAMELLQSFRYKIQNHFVYLFKSISLTY